jgi:hypothetical protein
MKSLLTLTAVLALALVSACNHHTHNAAELAGKADSGLYLAGTLATLGSFEWDVAPLTNYAATQLHVTALDLKANRITVAQAQARMDSIDHAHDVLVQALKACAQNGQGKCTGDEARARLLLDKARTALSNIP